MNPAQHTSRPANDDLTADTFATIPPHALFTDRADKTRLEAENGLAQFDEVCSLVEQSPTPGVLSLNPGLIRHFQYLAIRNIYVCAGEFRHGPVYINGVDHVPPPHDSVPRLVQDMCDLANARTDWPPLRTAAFLLWRHNWIHPFFGGNGRTSRVLAYYGLCARLGFLIPGTLTIPELITANRDGYYDALAQVDAAAKEGTLALGPMEAYLRPLLAKQLTSDPHAAENEDFIHAVYEAATTSPAAE